MNVFQVMVIVNIILGAMFILFSSIAFSDKKENSTGKAFDEYIENADHAMTELSDMSRSVMKDFDEKKQELLFLYSLIEDKKKEIGEFDKVKETAKPEEKIKQAPLNPEQRSKTEQVVLLSKSGLSVQAIAKRLNMGQGEVALILNLGGDHA